MAELVIFDCDGVLVDSERISLAVQAEHLCALGLDMTFEDCVTDFLGLGMSTSLAIIEERLGSPLPSSWQDELEAAVTVAFRERLVAIEGIEEALNAISLPTCIASSGSHAKMRLTLGLTGLYDRFEGRIFSADQVPNGKPAPDLFLFAATEMGVAPETCVVVEDSPAGIQAAQAAGMTTLAYAAMTPSDRLAAATVVFCDMHELPALLASEKFQDQGPGAASPTGPRPKGREPAN